MLCRNVSFRLDQGESMAVIGRNGAGKSTLLGLAAGLCKPSEGLVAVRGRFRGAVGTRLGIPQRPHRLENVRLNASLLGLSRTRTAEVLESIIDFSESGTSSTIRFETYSSGMIMRLGFSVAVHVDPDILIIDEVLGGGRSAFFKRSASTESDSSSRRARLCCCIPWWRHSAATLRPRHLAWTTARCCWQGLRPRSLEGL